MLQIAYSKHFLLFLSPLSSLLLLPLPLPLSSIYNQKKKKKKINKQYLNKIDCKINSLLEFIVKKVGAKLKKVDFELLNQLSTVGDALICRLSTSSFGKYYRHNYFITFFILFAMCKNVIRGFSIFVFFLIRVSLITYWHTILLHIY